MARLSYPHPQIFLRQPHPAAGPGVGFGWMSNVAFFFSPDCFVHVSSGSSLFPEADSLAQGWEQSPLARLAYTGLLWGWEER